MNRKTIGNDKIGKIARGVIADVCQELETMDLEKAAYALNAASVVLHETARENYPAAAAAICDLNNIVYHEGHKPAKDRRHLRLVK
jgi:hypothetical protein